MSTQEALEAAFQKIVENAEANCPFHTHRPWVIKDIDADRIVNAAKDCTCRATIDAAAEFGDELLDSINCICDGQDDKNAARVTINRLREEAK